MYLPWNSSIQGFCFYNNCPLENDTSGRRRPDVGYRLDVGCKISILTIVQIMKVLSCTVTWKERHWPRNPKKFWIWWNNHISMFIGRRGAYPHQADEGLPRLPRFAPVYCPYIVYIGMFFFRWINWSNMRYRCNRSSNFLVDQLNRSKYSNQSKVHKSNLDDIALIEL